MTGFDVATKRFLVGVLFCVAAMGVGGVWLARAEPGWFDPIYKNFQMASWFAAVVVAAFGIWKHFHEDNEKRTWERAKLAKELLDDLNRNPLALNATYMLGAWHGRWYERPAKEQPERFQVTQQQLAQVLEPNRMAASDNEDYVRECYDNFLFHLELCFAAVDSKLIDGHALEPMLLPLFAGIDRVSVLPQLQAYAAYLGYHRTAINLNELVEAALSKPAA